VALVLAGNGFYSPSESLGDQGLLTPQSKALNSMVLEMSERGTISLLASDQAP